MRTGRHGGRGTPSDRASGEAGSRPATIRHTLSNYEGYTHGSEFEGHEHEMINDIGKLVQKITDDRRCPNPLTEKPFCTVALLPVRTRSETEH